MDLPNATYLLVKNKVTGVDPLADKVLGNDPGDQTLKDNFIKARVIYLSRIKKMYTESCLIASKDLGEISKLLEIPVDVLTVYEQFFYRVSGLDKLSLLELVDSTDNMEERTCKMWALSQGLDFISWRLNGNVTINPVEGLQSIFALAVFKSKEAMHMGSASEGAKGAVNWTRLSLEIAKILKAWVSDNDAAAGEIQLALASLEPTFAGFADLDS